MLGVESYPDGSVDIPIPDNHGTVTNGSYLDKFQGRSGVLALNGTGAKMDVGLRAYEHNTNTFTFYTWFYLDEWVEGAFLFKKEASDNQGFSIRFGSAASREIIVRLNGAEYKRPLPTTPAYLNNWYHIAIATNPAAVTYEDYFQFIFNGGTNRSARDYPPTAPSTYIPQGIDNTPAVVGLNMKGKLDETVIWKGALTSSEIANYMNIVPFPSEKYAYDPVNVLYKMNSAWKYDDPNDLGWDTFSYKNIMKSVRDNFANHRGYTIRMSVKGHDNWQNTFTSDAKRKKMAQGIVEIAKEFDGIDLDFEWCYDGSCWGNYGLLINEITKLMPADKVFSVSPHGFSYQVPVSSMTGVDFFTFQIYGPQKGWFTWSEYERAYNNFRNHGFPANKILMSYATITSDAYDSYGNPSGVPVGIGYFTNPDYKPDMDSYVDEQGKTRYVTGVNQTRRRAEFIQDQGAAGIFYWDMGNDVHSSHPYSLARVSNFAIASNVDSIVYSVTTTGVENLRQTNFQNIQLYPNPASDFVQVLLPDESLQLAAIKIYNAMGQIVKQINVSSNSEKIPVSNLYEGVYVLQAQTSNDLEFRQTFIRKN